MTPARRRTAVRRRATSDVALLARATRTLGGTLDVTRVAARLTELAQAVLGADAAGDVADRARQRRAGPESRQRLHAIRSRSPVSPTPPVATSSTGSPIVPVRSSSARCRAAPGPPCGVGSRRKRCAAFLGVPLIGEATPVGVLGLFRRSGRPFTRTDLASGPDALRAGRPRHRQRSALYRPARAGRADRRAAGHRGEQRGDPRSAGRPRGYLAARGAGARRRALHDLGVAGRRRALGGVHRRGAGHAKQAPGRARRGPPGGADRAQGRRHRGHDAGGPATAPLGAVERGPGGCHRGPDRAGRRQRPPVPGGTDQGRAPGAGRDAARAGRAGRRRRPPPQQPADNRRRTHPAAAPLGKG